MNQYKREENYSSLVFYSTETIQTNKKSQKYNKIKNRVTF